MIHRLLEMLDSAVPINPLVALTFSAVFLIALGAWLGGRSRGTFLFAAAALLLAAGLAIGLAGIDRPGREITYGPVEDLAEALIGPPDWRRFEQLTTAGVVLAALLLYILYNSAFQEKPGRAPRRQLEQDEDQARALGSAHLCAPRTFRRWSRPDLLGWTIRGRFWGAKGQPLGQRLCLSGEDIARGVAVFGPQGSGKTQAVILPAIADRMRDGHSLIVTDVQGELQPFIERLAAVTGHELVVHNPSDPERSCALNLCGLVETVADARTMAAVLLSGAVGQGEPFWAEAAVNLVAACALHYPTFGAVLAARRNLQHMAKELGESDRPGVADLAADFINSIRSRDPKLALNIMAEAFNVGLAPWADPAIQSLTARSDLDLARQLGSAPTVLILRCSRRHTEAYGAYLGTVLRVLTSRLDALGEQAGGALSIPVGLILEEFPALGRLDSLVRDINLVRKRRISILTAAQSLSQFDHVYPARGEADRLLAGLATKIVLGGCDGRTAEFFSRLSGQATLAMASLTRSQRQGQGQQASATAHLQGRPLLLPDDLIRPARGTATIFAAYSQGRRAEQAIFHAELVPFFERKDWRLDGAKRVVPPTVRRDEPSAPANAASEDPGARSPEIEFE